MAVQRLAQAGVSSASEMLKDVHSRWFQLILDEVGDQSIAHLVILIGEGLYAHLATPDSWYQSTFDGRLQELLDLVPQLKKLKQLNDHVAGTCHMATDGANKRLKGRIGALLGILLMALSLRAAVVSVPPLLAPAFKKTSNSPNSPRALLRSAGPHLLCSFRTTHPAADPLMGLTNELSLSPWP